MARYSSIILCLALFCVVAFADRGGKQCSYTYNAVARSGAGGSWTACTGPTTPTRNCAFFQIYDVVIVAGANSADVTGCDFVFKPTNGVITDSWGYDTRTKEITFYNPLTAGNTQSLSGFIVRANKENVPIIITKTDSSPCECD